MVIFHFFFTILTNPFLFFQSCYIPPFLDHFFLSSFGLHPAAELYQSSSKELLHPRHPTSSRLPPEPSHNLSSVSHLSRLPHSLSSTSTVFFLAPVITAICQYSRLMIIWRPQRRRQQKALQIYLTWLSNLVMFYCQIRYKFRVWPLYRYPYTFQHFFLISCIFTITSLHYNCSILLLLILHISSSIFLHLLTFTSFFSINIRTSSSALVPYTPYHLIISCSSRHSTTKCLRVSSPPHSKQSTAPPSKPCLHLSFRVFVLHCNNRTKPYSLLSIVEETLTSGKYVSLFLISILYINIQN